MNNFSDEQIMPIEGDHLINVFVMFWRWVHNIYAISNIQKPKCKIAPGVTTAATSTQSPAELCVKPLLSD